MVNPFTPEFGGAVNRSSPDDALRAMGIELSSATQRLYSNSRGPIWVNKPNLFEDLRSYAASHGIHDTFVDSAVIDTLLATNKPSDRAIADRLMTESIIRTAKEISSRSDVNDFAGVFSSAMAPRNSPRAALKLIADAMDASAPQHPMYADMRRQYNTLLEKGNMDDPKLVSLRVNMARVRQDGIIGETPRQNQILVNVAAGKMVYDVAGTQGESRVIIGEGEVTIKDKIYNKRTPIGEGSVQGITLHQPWRPTINIAERRGLMAQIPMLLETGARHYVEPNGTRFEFDPNLVNSPHVSPFKMLAGSNNPMGFIKVSLGGTFGRSNIYIHDTPDKPSAFANFAQSSGCMRTEGITQLAAALTRDPYLGERYGYANNQALFEAAKETVKNPLTGQMEMRHQMNGIRVPVHGNIKVKTVYQTVTYDPITQTAIVHKDIYKRDTMADRPSRNAMPDIQLEQEPVLVADRTRTTQPGAKPRYQG